MGRFRIIENNIMRFVALHPSEEAMTLIRTHPNAFLLLTQIAMRARWEDCRISGVKAGESFIGDWKEAGLKSEMAYRHAKKVLEKLGFATFRGTSRGTVGTISDSTIYSFSKTASNEQRNRQATDKERTRNDQGTTNYSEYSEDFDTLNTPPTPQGGNAKGSDSFDFDEEPSDAPMKPLSAKPDGYPDFIESLWSEFPPKSRLRSTKKKLFDEWKRLRHKPHNDDLRASLRAWCKTEEWTKEGGQFAPGAHRFIKERKFESTPEAAPIAHKRSC